MENSNSPLEFRGIWVIGKKKVKKKKHDKWFYKENREQKKNKVEINRKYSKYIFTIILENIILQINK